MGLGHILYHWQTLIAGLLAVVAAFFTIRATNSAASREISAAREQTEVAREQIDVALRLERRRLARESHTFLAAMEAAMGGVVEDVAVARDLSKNIGTRNNLSVPAYEARQRVKKIAFADLRSACIRLGGQLTAPFLRLEKDIDDLGSNWKPMPTAGLDARVSPDAGLSDQLDRIEKQAAWLQESAADGMKKCNEVLQRTEHGARKAGLID
ncbi:hypothetical protein SAMN05519103_08790 [Rhizobiales bacterium GAS113]|nr:hypothetical protein SAMN05519103_08790 [Rhizobiales bacterium GAS113]SEF04035.1 hypothetical protein SAMN05519104_8034 [Rhizobiales bacterium GAS188]